MRLLHTSDWHLGRKLYDRSRFDEQQQFLQWLLKIIQEEKIDLLLIAGDIFDTSIPPANVMDQYYEFLFHFYQETAASAVIIAGNHDSATRLAAPRQFLKMARIHLMGNMPDHPEELIIDVKNSKDLLAIVALPYLPEGEILSHISFESEIESAQRYREAIKQLYHQAISAVPQHVSTVLMGHFFLAGGQSSDSERPIQVGGSVQLTLADLPEGAAYAALGHLHKPQSFKKHPYPVIYSGSPIPMTFKEAEYDKKIYIVDIHPGQPAEFQEITVPVFRHLARVHGTFDEIMDQVQSNDWDGKLIEIQLHLDFPRVGISDQIRQAFDERGGEVASVQAVLLQEDEKTTLSPEEITSQNPQDIFTNFYQDRFGPADSEKIRSQFETLQNTFADLIKIWQQKQQEATE